MWNSRPLSNQCLRAARLLRSSRQANQSLSLLINDALCITSNVTSAMLVMSDTPVAISSYALMDIEERPRQCANTMTVDTRAGFQMTFTIVLRCWKIAITSLIVSLMRCYPLKKLRPCLNVQSDSVRAKVFGWPMQISDSGFLWVTLEIAYLI